MNSEKFLGRLHECPDEESRAKLIGLAVEYCVLHPDCAGFDTFISVPDLHNLPIKQRAALLVRSIAHKLDIAEADIPSADFLIFSYFKENVVKKGYFYHGFNGNFEDEIVKQGLRTKNRLWEWEELYEIAAIGKRAGVGMLLGWLDLNCENRVSCAATTGNLYRYSVASPEWFAQFVSEGFHIPNQKNKKGAFYRRDYQTARQNIEELCERLSSRNEDDIRAGKAYPNITSEEKDKLLDFFEKYWKIFTGERSLPRAALISRLALQEDVLPFETLDDYKTFLKDAKLPADIESIIESCLLLDDGNNDIQVGHDISPENLRIIELPAYEKVNPKSVA